MRSRRADRKRGEVKNMGASNAQPNSIRETVRWAGILYLAIFAVAPLAFFAARSTIVVDGDAATTAKNLVEN